MDRQHVFCSSAPPGLSKAFLSSSPRSEEPPGESGSLMPSSGVFMGVRPGFSVILLFGSSGWPYPRDPPFPTALWAVGKGMNGGRAGRQRRPARPYGNAQMMRRPWGVGWRPSSLALPPRKGRRGTAAPLLHLSGRSGSTVLSAALQTIGSFAAGPLPGGSVDSIPGAGGLS